MKKRELKQKQKSKLQTTKLKLQTTKSMATPMRKLKTIWGEQLDSNHVLEEYPRPQMVRESYINLNGYWDYAITQEEKRPLKPDGKILVPFSPESNLSGVERQLRPKEYLWYMRTFETPQMKAGEHLLLHFGAVDQAVVVYVNKKQAGKHVGGYLPFSIDVTEFLQSNNELVLKVRDYSDTSYHTRGKQKLKRGGMFYTAQSGIWQTVWMEVVPENAITEIKTTPKVYKETITFLINAKKRQNVQIRITTCSKDQLKNLQQKGKKDAEREEEISREIREVGITMMGRTNEEIDISLPNPLLWSPQTPWLYHFEIQTMEDRVTGYFAMRSFTVEPDKAQIPRLCINHVPCFQKGVLDQGYWPDGLYTAPSDKAFIADICSMKELGFDMMRKHLKIEADRWYYHCDRLGMLVWQDMVNGGESYPSWYVTYLATVMTQFQWKWKDNNIRLLGRRHLEGRKQFAKELKQTISHLYNHPCICTWVLFNEGWGQFSTNEITELARQEDTTRWIDQASGWFDQGGGDIQSIHHYFFHLHLAQEQRRAAALTEFGGYSMQILGHTSCEKEYGYGKFRDLKELNRAYKTLVKETEKLEKDGLCGMIYTQLSDVEEETNGILTYDRKIKKIWEQI